MGLPWHDATSKPPGMIERERAIGFEAFAQDSPESSSSYLLSALVVAARISRVPSAIDRILDHSGGFRHPLPQLLSNSWSNVSKEASSLSFGEYNPASASLSSIIRGYAKAAMTRCCQADQFLLNSDRASRWT